MDVKQVLILSFVFIYALLGCRLENKIVGHGQLTSVTNTPTLLPNKQVDVQQTMVGDSYFYYYVDGGRVQLVPSLNWVAVEFVSNSMLNQKSVFQGSIIDTNHPSREISEMLVLFPLRENVTVSSLVQGIRKLNANYSDVLRISPIFLRDNTEMFISEEFIATFPVEKSKQEILDINSLNDVEIANPVLGQDNTFLLRVTEDADLDALSMANLYQETGVAIHAAPNFVRIMSQD